MSDRREYMREYMRRRRQEARKSGLCIICLSGKPYGSNVTCDACQDAANEYKTPKK